MAWIESHQTLSRHPKTKRLARLLGVSIPTAIGHLHLLWWWALDFAQDGDISSYTAVDIAEAALWTADPDTFLGALVDSGDSSHAGFVERQDATYRLHDWADYAGRLIDQRATNAERMRLARAAKVSARAPHVRHTCAARVCTCGATVPNLTVPNLTVPNLTVPNQTEPIRADALIHAPDGAVRVPEPAKRKERATNTYSADFDVFWSIYPRREDKYATWVEWQARLKEGATVADLIAAASNLMQHCENEGTEQRYIPHGRTFLGKQRRYESFVASPPVAPAQLVVAAASKVNGPVAPSVWLQKKQRLDQITAEMDRRGL